MSAFAKLPMFRLLARDWKPLPISQFVINNETENELRDILLGITELKGERGLVGLDGGKGEKGERGIVGGDGRRGRRGIRGLSGLTPDHNVTESKDGYVLRFKQPSGEWGPELFVKQGEVGPQGEVGGKGGRGDKGEKGDKGDEPAHEWRGTALRFRRPSGTWGELVNLQGAPGMGGGTRGRSANPGFTEIVLNGTDLEFRRPSAGPLGQPVVVDLSSLSAGGDVNNAQRVDEAGSVIYIGDAVPGTLDDASAWRIKRVTFIKSGQNTDSRTEWAGGDSNRDNIWNDRLGFTYT